jgi:kinetochore protein Spc25
MSSVEEIAAQLDRQLNEATSRIDEFLASQSQQIAKSAAEHDQLMDDMEAKIQQLSNNETNILKMASSVNEQLANEQKIIAEKQNEILKLEASVKTIPVELDAASASEASAKRQLDALKHEILLKEKALGGQVEDVNVTLQHFKRLGLEFEKTNDEKLRVTFTLINSVAPEKSYSFCIRVNGIDQYEMSSLDSAWDPRVVQHHLTALNIGGDFSKFVQSMRSALKK